MSNIPKVSIIVPIYNAQYTLARCIESIINQTLEEIEIILVDDGSTDSSLTIAEGFKKQDKRIQVITQNNYGVSYARNRGIEVATGRYIGFVDADDWIEKEMYELMYEAIQGNELCMIECDMIYPNKTTIERKYLAEKTLINMHEIKEYVVGPLIGCIGQHEHIGSEVWNYLFRADIIKDNQLCFPSSIPVGEDLIFLLRYFCYVERMQIVHKVGYHYIVHNTSALNRYREKDLEEREAYLVQLRKTLEYKYFQDIQSMRFIIGSINSCIESITNICKVDNPHSRKEKIAAITEVLKRLKDIKKKNLVAIMKKYPTKRRLIVFCMRYNMKLIIYYYYTYKNRSMYKEN